MDMTHCKHLRITNDSDSDMEIENFIKTLEMQYKFDFRSLPEWKRIIDMMYVIQFQYRDKIKSASKRKYEIIENLNREYSRLSPFQLTDRLARTAKRWALMKTNFKKRKEIIKEESILLFDQELINNHEYTAEESEVNSTAHPNTEVIQSKDVLISKPDLDSDVKSISFPVLPASICTNQHKKLSSLGSKYSDLSYLGSTQFENIIKLQTVEESNEIFDGRKSIQFYPDQLNVNNKTYKEQLIKICLRNYSMEYVYIRFKGIQDPTYFKKFTVVPSTPIKLYPGLSFTFKLILKLLKYIEAESLRTFAKFQIGRNVYSESKDDVLCVPIVSKSSVETEIKVTETVYIPPVYKWHVNAKCGYPKGLGKIYVDGNTMYHLHIRKKDVDFFSPESSTTSNKAINSDTDSLILKKEDTDIELQNEVILTNPKITNVIEPISDKDTLIKTADIVTVLLEDIVDLAFEPFVFKQTYLRLLPKIKRIFQVFFTKPEHVGFYHTYYELEFRHFNTNEIITTRIIKVFAEVLPHPITINPQILDMTHSPITLGYCKNYFTITNNNKVYPVNIKIKTTTKMQKLFKITPMESLIPTRSYVNFEVSFCVKQNDEEDNSRYLSYFTIKIIVCGHKTIYQNSPPFFYEIITPCAKEFKKVYGRKYFCEKRKSSQDT